MLPYGKNLKHLARDLRKDQTDAEQRLWSHIRRKQLADVQFYRQKPIGPYIVDFYAPRAKLVVEIDGAQHREGEHASQDAARDAYLESLGLKVLRFDNVGVWWDTALVVAQELLALSSFSVVTDRVHPEHGQRRCSPPSDRRSLASAPW
jgi:very-short-patch-repair endonuclease